MPFVLQYVSPKILAILFHIFLCKIRNWILQEKKVMESDRFVTVNQVHLALMDGMSWMILLLAFQGNELIILFLSPVCTTTITTTTTCTSTSTTSRSYSRAPWRVLTLKYTRSWRGTFLFIYETDFPKCEAGSCFSPTPFTLQWVWVISQKCVIANLQGEILLMVIGEAWLMRFKNLYRGWHLSVLLFMHGVSLNISFVNIYLNYLRQLY